MTAAAALCPLGEWQEDLHGSLPAAPRLSLVPSAAESVCGRAPIRLTRSGRLVRSALLMAAAMSLLCVVSSGVWAAASSPAPTVTVAPGQTLSSIATYELPDLPVREGVARIQLVNGLSSSDVHAGQVLQIPVDE